jgi:RNA polymerase sigma-70 factor (ECF subfamily)
MRSHALSPLNEFPISRIEPDGERTLVQRAQAGDLDAFEALYHAHAARVYALGLRMTGDEQRAREMTQDVFVRAWEGLRAFRGDSAFGSWLHRIAVNAVLMDARADSRRRARVSLRDEMEREGDGEATDGFAPPIDIEQGIDLERAIAALPPGARRVFVLHDIEGYRHEEIARMTGSAQGTLRAQLHRARKLLMEALSR